MRCCCKPIIGADFLALLQDQSYAPSHACSITSNNESSGSWDRGSCYITRVLYIVRRDAVFYTSPTFRSCILVSVYIRQYLTLRTFPRYLILFIRRPHWLRLSLFFSTNSSAFWNLEVSMLIEPDVGQSPHDTPGTGYFKAGLAQAVILICTTIPKCLSNPPTDTAFVFLFASACSRSKIKGLLPLSLLLCVLHLNFSWDLLAEYSSSFSVSWPS